MTGTDARPDARPAGGPAEARPGDAPPAPRTRAAGRGEPPSRPTQAPPSGPRVPERDRWSAAPSGAPESARGSASPAPGEGVRASSGSPRRRLALLTPLLLFAPLGPGCSTPAGPPTSPAPTTLVDGEKRPAPAAAREELRGEGGESGDGGGNERGDKSGDKNAGGPKPPRGAPGATSIEARDDRSAAELEPEPEPEPQLDPIDALRQRTPRCTDPDRHCFGVHLHIVADADGVPVQTLDWVSAQLAGAQDRFTTSVDASFEVVAVDTLPSEQRDIVSRLDRDRLGRPHFSRGVVHVFIVGSLADVDNPGEIRGVHWRDRSNTARRWVILSSIAGSMTLTHELGHFFSLPHSTYADSLMNKRPGGKPFAQRGFHPKEAARMRRAKATMLADKMLTARTVSSSETERKIEPATEPAPASEG